METKNKQVVITDINIKPVNSSMVYMLDTNGGKFSFFNKKQDGGETKAFEQFSKFNFKKGDSVEIAYTEKVSDKINSFTGKPYVNYNVMYFVTADEHTPATPRVQSNVSQTMHPEIPTIQVEDENRGIKYETTQDNDVKIADLASRMRVVEEFLGIGKEEGLNISDVPF